MDRPTKKIKPVIPRPTWVKYKGNPKSKSTTRLIIGKVYFVEDFFHYTKPFIKINRELGPLNKRLYGARQSTASTEFYPLEFFEVVETDSTKEAVAECIEPNG